MTALAQRMPTLLNLMSAKATFTVAQAETLSELCRAELYARAKRGELKIRNGLILRSDLEALLEKLFTDAQE